VVNGDGTTARQSGSTSSARLGLAGQYEVIFNRDVSACSYQVTQSNPSGVTGETIAQPRSSDANGVFVATANSAGLSSDRSFHLAVFC
jgi:hypothetical protein